MALFLKERKCDSLFGALLVKSKTANRSLSLFGKEQKSESLFVAFVNRVKGRTSERVKERKSEYPTLNIANSKRIPEKPLKSAQINTLQEAVFRFVPSLSAASVPPIKTIFYYCTVFDPYNPHKPMLKTSHICRKPRKNELNFEIDFLNYIF